MSVTLTGGPMDGQPMPEGVSGLEYHFPMVGMNDDGNDMKLSTARYRRDGSFIDVVVNTETMNADHFREMAKYWEREDRKTALINRLLDEGVITEEDL